MKKIIGFMLGTALIFSAGKSKEYEKVEQFYNDANYFFQAAGDCEALGYAFFEHITSMSQTYETIEKLSPREREKAEKLMEDLEKLLVERQQELCGGLSTSLPDSLDTTF